MRLQGASCKGCKAAIPWVLLLGLGFALQGNGLVPRARWGSIGLAILWPSVQGSEATPVFRLSGDSRVWDASTCIPGPLLFSRVLLLGGLCVPLGGWCYWAGTVPCRPLVFVADTEAFHRNALVTIHNR